MRIVDATVARLRADAERDGRWPTMHLWIVSDHGHSPVHTHEDLAGLLRAWGVRTRAHPWTAGPGHHAAVMVSGNAMAHVYLDLALRERPWWPRLRGRWDWLADRLLARSPNVERMLSSLAGLKVLSRAGLMLYLSGALTLLLGTLAAFGAFVEEVPPPLGIGTLALADGRAVKGFVCEPHALEDATDITAYGGWRAYLAARATA